MAAIVSAGTPAQPTTTSARRDAIRLAIKRSARAELRAHGPAGVAMRAVARTVGIPVSSLYRHFTDRAALMTELQVDAYQALIEQLALARDCANPSDSRAQWCAMARALRAWALANPDEFSLLYGPPVSGEEGWAPPVHEQRSRAGSLVGSVLAEAIRTGQLVPETPGTTVQSPDPPWLGHDGPLDPVVVRITMGGWSALVGHLCLEGRRASMVLDPAQHYEEYLEAVLAGMGFVPETSDMPPGPAT